MKITVNFSFFIKLCQQNYLRYTYSEVQWYEFRDKGGLPVLRTHEELALEDTSFWNNHELKSIVLKDLE